MRYFLARYLRDSVTRRGKRKGDFHLLIHSLTGSDSQDWAWLNPGAKNSIWFSDVGCRGPIAWTIFCFFSRHISLELDGSGAALDSPVP